MASGNFMSKLPTSCSVAMLLFILTPCCVIYGCGEWRVSHGTSAEAVAADLARLERGSEPPNNHILLGPHVACYYSGVYEYLTDRDHPTRPGPDTDITSYYYPIVSPADPNVQEIDRLLEEYETLDDVPDDVPIPPIDEFRVIVKTDRFDDVKSLPQTAVIREESLQGLVINRVEELDEETKEYIRESFPGIKLGNVLIVEEGRRPSSMFFAQGVTFCATGLWVFSIILAIVGTVQAIVRAASPKRPEVHHPSTRPVLNAPVENPPAESHGAPPIRRPPTD